MTTLEIAQVTPLSKSESNESYVEWSAVLAGAVLAAAISFVLLTFGSAIGLSMASPYKGEGASIWAFGVSAGLWVLWVEVFSFIAGGYIAGRLRRRLNDSTEHEVHVRDGAHGLLVWATGVLVAAALAAGGGASASSAAKAAIAVSNPVSMSAIGGDLFRPLPGSHITFDAPARGAALSIMARTAGGTMGQGDRDYVASVVSDQTGIAVPDAQARVDAGHAQANQAVIDAKKAADAARKTGILAAFCLAASLAVSAAAAYVAAGYGGHHRDKGVVLPLLGRGW